MTINSYCCESQKTISAVKRYTRWIGNKLIGATKKSRSKSSRQNEYVETETGFRRNQRECNEKVRIWSVEAICARCSDFFSVSTSQEKNFSRRILYKILGVKWFIENSEKKVVLATRNLRTNSASTMYYKMVITTMNK